MCIFVPMQQWNPMKPNRCVDDETPVECYCKYLHKNSIQYRFLWIFVSFLFIVSNPNTFHYRVLYIMNGNLISLKWYLYINPLRYMKLLQRQKSNTGNVTAFCLFAFSFLFKLNFTRVEEHPSSDIVESEIELLIKFN